MNPAIVAFLRSWTFEPWAVVACVLTAIIYWRGWHLLVARRSEHFGVRHLVFFLSGIVTILAAVCSPLDAYAPLLLSVHMAQHLLLMLVAPALIVLGAPQLPLTLGLPAPVLEYWVVPALRSRIVRRLAHAAANPLVAWGVAAVTLWFWHVPSNYELALESTFWHRFEHAAFFASSLLFWWPVIEPYPSRPRWPRVAVVPYLFLAAMQASALCAFLTFSDRVIYPRYEATGGLWGFSPLTDQAVAGAMMWVAGIVAYLVPLGLIGQQLLYGTRRRRTFVSPDVGQIVPHDGATNGLQVRGGAARSSDLGFDLLRVPVFGRIVRHPFTRRAAQVMLLAVAVLIVVDGLTGPAAAPLNLAGVLPWIHWRGLVVLGLLIGANFFCSACPITLPRAVLRRFIAPRWEWPAALRSKYLAVALLVAFFWAYEVFDLWASPWLTAWIIIGYFLVAFAIDAMFRGASFCKYVCPIGQFQFVQSLISPWEVRVRDADVCTSCRTRECIRGGEGVRGCEMQLPVPKKASNLDCTFCLDCVNACPAANIGIIASLPGSQLLPIASHAPSDRLAARPGVALLILCLVFAAFANAAGMIAPVVQGQDRMVAKLSLSRFVVESACLLTLLVIVPFALVIAAAALARRAAGDKERMSTVVARFAGAFVPLGAAMWLAHYGFHLATGCLAFLPAAGRFLHDWGATSVSADSIVRSCCAIEPPAWLLQAEIFALDVGLLATLYLVYCTARAWHLTSRRATAAFMPWGLLALALFAFGIWIVYQPMEMRGALPAGSAG